VFGEESVRVVAEAAMQSLDLAGGGVVGAQFVDHRESPSASVKACYRESAAALHSSDRVARNEPVEKDTRAPAIRAEAIESLLVERGLVTEEAIDEVIARFNERIGPMNGARVVARAWTDPAFKAALLADGTSAIAPYEFEGGQVDKLVVVENTPTVHNVVACTLCSCYPWALLGLPPRWYKDPAYRSRIVREPRAVLREFGLDLPADVEVRVWDSSAEVRYLVLPLRPDSTEGLDEGALATRVTRDAMIGVAR
jgi:nitrile hydratase